VRDLDDGRSEDRRDARVDGGAAVQDQACARVGHERPAGRDGCAAAAELTAQRRHGLARRGGRMAVDGEHESGECSKQRDA
jgi:hypothetical protein